MSNYIPYSVSGTITASDASNPSGVRVVVRNDRTIETTTAETDSSGNYVVNLGNLTSGYATGDSITTICAYGLDYGDVTFTVSGGSKSSNDITMTETVASSEIDYCTISEVWDELDGKTSSDISATRIKSAIKRAEAYVDLKTNTSYKLNTVTDRIYSTNPDSMYASRESVVGGVSGGLQRADRTWIGGDTIKLEFSPIVAITSLYKNEAGSSETDSWTELDEQSGSGGDFMLDKQLSAVTFVQDLPPYGVKRAIKTTFTWGIDRDSTSDVLDLRKIELVRELTILLAVRTILTSKLHSARFDDVDDIRLEAISTLQGTNQVTTYLRHIGDRVTELFGVLGDLNSSLQYDGGF